MQETLHHNPSVRPSHLRMKKALAKLIDNSVDIKNIIWNDASHYSCYPDRLVFFTPTYIKPYFEFWKQEFLTSL